MAAVLIACPQTGSLVPTGANALSLDDLATDNLLAACPECGRDHDWTPGDAVLSTYATEATSLRS